MDRRFSEGVGKPSRLHKGEGVELGIEDEEADEIRPKQMMLMDKKMAS